VIVRVNDTIQTPDPTGGGAFTPFDDKSPGTVRVTAAQAFGVTIEYYLNNSLIAIYTDTSFANTGNITTSNGNLYSFYCYAGI
jgi:hypothetical protein